MQIEARMSHLILKILPSSKEMQQDRRNDNLLLTTITKSNNQSNSSWGLRWAKTSLKTLTWQVCRDIFKVVAFAKATVQRC